MEKSVPRVDDSGLGCMILLLAVFAACASLAYLQPPYCPPALANNICKPGEQTAGFPLPILHDARSGGSPMSSWGRMDFNIEDVMTFNILAFLANTLFYALLLWLPLGVVRLVSRLIRR